MRERLGTANLLVGVKGNDITVKIKGGATCMNIYFKDVHLASRGHTIASLR